MNIEFTLPPPDLLADFDAIEEALLADTSGAKARCLREYFKAAEVEMRETQLRSTDFDDKNLAGIVADALGASARVVAAAWNKLHGRELAA
jgi:hypothetical protein